MFNSILHLLFPQTCVACNGNLLRNENHLCTSCSVDLPQTRFHQLKDNTLEKVFWGRLTIVQAYSFLYFKKGNSVQHILHEIKYKNNMELAQFMGSLYGSILYNDGIRVDGIVAIPLHKSKLRQRGYNQSELIVKGMAESMHTQNLSKSISRIKATETQTRKHRFERWENVEEVFSIANANEIANKHILLLDDVITTGATIEACGNSILKVEGCKLSVASIAFAVN